jgi:hypothetical protein
LEAALIAGGITRNLVSQIWPYGTLFDYACFSPKGEMKMFEPLGHPHIFEVTAIPTSLAGIAAFAKGVGRFDVIAQQPLC